MPHWLCLNLIYYYGFTVIVIVLREAESSSPPAKWIQTISNARNMSKYTLFNCHCSQILKTYLSGPPACPHLADWAHDSTVLLLFKTQNKRSHFERRSKTKNHWHRPSIIHLSSSPVELLSSRYYLVLVVE